VQSPTQKFGNCGHLIRSFGIETSAGANASEIGATLDPVLIKGSEIGICVAQLK
jgi:hypothetical protein